MVILSTVVNLITMPTVIKYYGDRSFQSTAADVWNSIPVDKRSSDSVASFCRHLKTLLCAQATVLLQLQHAEIVNDARSTSQKKVKVKA